MQGQLFHNTALAIAMLFSSLAVAEAPSRDMVAVATYKGQAEKLGSMPPMFKASARFKTNKVLWLNDSGHPDRALSFAQQ